MIPPTARALLVGLFLASSAGCAGTSPRVESPLARPPIALRGHLDFEARHPTPTGASRELARKPARHVSILAVDGDGEVLGRFETDGQGDFAFDAPGATERLRFLAEVRWQGGDLVVATDPLGTVPHAYEVAASASAPMRLVAPEDDTHGPAGAFHIVDTMLKGAEAVHAWTGRTLPPCYVFWGRGVTSDWSYYRGERPEGSGRYALELLGGESGHQSRSDTDEHDEVIVLHEFGHFVFDRLSTDSSPGGTHPVGVLVEPGLAWEEARASWFATVVLGDPNYRDTIGVEPAGELRVNVDFERQNPGPRGIGSEATVAEILWDLADGSPGVPDRDGDGVAIAPAALFTAMTELVDVPGAYPSIASYLAHVVDRGLATREAVRDLLARGGQPVSLLPEGTASLWPIDLGVPGEAAGKVDSISDPAPSGGPRRPGNGFDAVRTYRIHVEQGGWLEVDLAIHGSGSPEAGQDLDLELRDLRSELLASSAGTGASESLGRFVTPGWYIVTVRDGGRGSRVGYSIRVRMAR